MAMPNYQDLFDAIVNGDRNTAAAITRQALDAGAPALELIQTYMIPAMDETGRRFECEEYFVPELLLAARAMKSALELLRPHLAEQGAQPAGKVVIGTAKGDLHDIGKNLVASMLEGAGFTIVDLGADVPPEKFAETAKAEKADLICMSALLTVTMPSMKATVEALEAAGIRRSVKVLIGGAPVTQKYADEIGADGYAETAAGAVALARRAMAAA
jgi:5-methyltetrahydrofolate--homocysteine methyltransferase